MLNNWIAVLENATLKEMKMRELVFKGDGDD